MDLKPEPNCNRDITIGFTGQSAGNLMTRAIRIRRGYAGTAGRQVHYRIAGSGPPLVLFHQSPRSSAEYIPLIERWAADFTVIAPDTPGYGASDPLARPDTPEMPDFARAMTVFMDDIGLERAAIYGFHTGASLSVALAAHAPERIVAAVANGLAAMEDGERDDILANYLPPFAPTWDGSHLTWLWARLREQVIFFPWYDRRNEARMSYPMSDPAKMDAQVLDMLWSGDHYGGAYRAAFAFDKSAAFARVQSPLMITAAPSDPLASHLDRLSPLPDSCTIERPESPEATLECAHGFLRQASLPPFEFEATAPGSGKGIMRGFVDVAFGGAGGDAQLHYQRAGPAGGETIILLHDLYSSSRVLTDEILHLSQRHDVIAFDLPGHGLSDDLPPASETTPDAYAARLADAVQGLCQGSVRIVAFGLAAGVGVALSGKLGSRASRLLLVDSHFPTEEYRVEFAANYLPDLTANAHGGHLLAGWRFARGLALFWPWFREDIPGIRPVDSEIDPGKIQQRFVALWESRARHRRISPKFFAAPTEDELSGLPVRWLHPAWADGMAAMARPWTGADAVSYADGDADARLSALSAALSAALSDA